MRTLLLKSLLARPLTIAGPNASDAALAEIAREVAPGSGNGCEREIHALNNSIYDVERFGIRFAASPRHADVLLVTGPVTKNMKVALERTYAATPDPKCVVAVGDCACGCGVFRGSYAGIGA